MKCNFLQECHSPGTKNTSIDFQQHLTRSRFVGIAFLQHERGLASVENKGFAAHVVILLENQTSRRT